jgi:hypothetical protein
MVQMLIANFHFIFQQLIYVSGRTVAYLSSVVAILIKRLIERAICGKWTRFVSSLYGFGGGLQKNMDRLGHVDDKTTKNVNLFGTDVIDIIDCTLYINSSPTTELFFYFLRNR